jgi:mono/diheme cytochrome c family protein
MILNVVSVLVLILLILLFGWLAWGLWHARNGSVRWLGGILSSLLTLVAAALTVVVLLGFYRMNVAPYKYSQADVEVAMSPEQIALGERYAHGCADCHSSSGNLPLDGSKENFLAGGMPLGVLYAPNLTPAGLLKDWSDADIARAIREGVNKDGQPLMIMPSSAFHALSDADVQALVAYIRSQPPVERDLPQRDLTALAAVFLGSGMFPTSAQPPITQPVSAPPPGSAAYGEYLTRAMGCRDCHGPNLEGMSGDQGPAAPNLTVIVPNWSEENLMKLFRNGVDPSGNPVSDEMPWKSYGKMFTDDQLKDLYAYLSTLQPITVKQP